MSKIDKLTLIILLSALCSCRSSAETVFLSRSQKLCVGTDVASKSISYGFDDSEITYLFKGQENTAQAYESMYGIVEAEDPMLSPSSFVLSVSGMDSRATFLNKGGYSGVYVAIPNFRDESTQKTGVLRLLIVSKGDGNDYPKRLLGEISKCSNANDDVNNFKVERPDDVWLWKIFEAAGSGVVR